jgi:hypothetical protein
VFEITHFKKKSIEVLRYGGLQIELLYKKKLSQTSLKKKLNIVISGFNQICNKPLNCIDSLVLCECCVF